MALWAELCAKHTGISPYNLHDEDLRSALFCPYDFKIRRVNPKKCSAKSLIREGAKESWQGDGAKCLFSSFWVTLSTQPRPASAFIWLWVKRHEGLCAQWLDWLILHATALAGHSGWYVLGFFLCLRSGLERKIKETVVSTTVFLTCTRG